MPILPPLPRSQRRRIHKIIHATRDKGHARRLMAILLLHEGLNRPYFPRHLKSLKLRSFRRCYEQAATLHGRIQTGRRQAGD
ncbi:hypothetical protein CJP16_21515 [Aeromonas sobria]|uniref:Uncharacterized protein n=1 Tax=Aeromonas sobria TaxID=646 RepID=A0A2N3IN92_AERSO|nr:hypothetical protein CJP16_21515 [Aeromonas sobria]